MAVSYKLKTSDGYPVTMKNPNSWSSVPAHLVPNIRYPHCMHLGTFGVALQHDLNIHHIKAVNTAPIGTSTVGVRVCPNLECRGIVFVVIGPNEKVVALPNEVLDFDPSNIPAPIAASLEEAIKCHSIQSYKAAAMMVRRVLEELCEDRAAKGENLKERLVALSKIVIVPPELLAAADRLRLLGNDAAHIEAKTYQSIGEAEVQVAIELTKELLKGAYQYKGLLEKLTALQKPT